KFKTDSAKYFVSSGFTNSLALRFEPTTDFAIALKYDGADISEALINFSQENYSIVMHYKLPSDFLSDMTFAERNTGILGKLKFFGKYYLVGGLAHKNNQLPWIVGIDGETFKLFMANNYFTDDLELLGEIVLSSPFNLSICGMYSLNNTFFASINFSAEQFGLYLSIYNSKLSSEIYTKLGQDKFKLGGAYDLYYGDSEMYAAYLTKQIEYYIGSNLSNVEFKITSLGKDRDIGLGVKTELSDPINKTNLTIFGNIRF
ncbi:MAG: glycoside hydrolase family 13, partial [Fervidobacterium sp.]